MNIVSTYKSLREKLNNFFSNVILNNTENSNPIDIKEVAPVKKRVIRGGKPVLKYDCPPGYRYSHKDHKCMKIPTAELRMMSMKQKRAAKLRKNSNVRLKRKRSIMKRRAMS
jgi:hypothetical protein